MFNCVEKGRGKRQDPERMVKTMRLRFNVTKDCQSAYLPCFFRKLRYKKLRNVIISPSIKHYGAHQSQVYKLLDFFQY